MDHDYYKNKKILIVDDEPQLLEMVSSILAQDGFTNTETASTVSQAVEKAREYQPNLAVLDVMLPDGDGFGLLEKLREFTRIPVLFLTARGEDEDSLCEAAWGDNPYGYENSLMAHIRRIREKIEKSPSKPESLITVKGLGYKLLTK